LFPHLTLRENTEFAADLLGVPEDNVDAVLVQVGLSSAASRQADECSFGMQRRAEFAALLLSEPELLLFDEAQAGLDATATELVGYLVKTTIARGGGAVVVSHQPDHGGLALDRRLQLDHGSVELLA